MLRQGSGVWFHLRVFSSVKTACVIFAYLLAVLVQAAITLQLLRVYFRFFGKAHCLGLHVIYSIAGSIVRWVPKGITIIKDWPAETGICNQLISQTLHAENILYSREFWMRSLL